MANTKNNQNKTNKSGKNQSSRKNTRKKKNSSDDTMKFLLVLIIAGIAIALIFFSQSKDDPAGNTITGTPAPTAEAGTAQNSVTPEPTLAGTEQTPDSNTPVPTTGALMTPEATPASEQTTVPTVAPTPTTTPTSTPTPTNTPTPTPTPALSATEAEKIVKAKVDTSVYDVQLVNEKLQVGNGRYYQFGAIANQEFIYPFLVVNQADGSLHFYDSTEGTVFGFTKFPLKTEATPTPTPQPSKNLTVEDAYKVLCTYSKESLQIAKEVVEYEAEYGNELTLISGMDCYRITLLEFSNGKSRNKGEFYVSIDGAKCFYFDNNINEFILVIK